MDAVHVDLAGSQSAQQGFDFGVAVCIGGEYLNEPAIVRQLLQPGSSCFKSFKRQPSDFWFGLLWRRRGEDGFDLWRWRECRHGRR